MISSPLGSINNMSTRKISCKHEQAPDILEMSLPRLEAHDSFLQRHFRRKPSSVVFGSLFIYMSCSGCCFEAHRPHWVRMGKFVNAMYCPRCCPFGDILAFLGKHTWRRLNMNGDRIFWKCLCPCFRRVPNSYKDILDRCLRLCYSGY